MIVSEFDVNNMKAWIYPKFFQWFRLVGYIFLAHFGYTLGPLVQNELCLNGTVVLCIITDLVHRFMMTTVYQSTSSRITDHVTELELSQTGFLNIKISSLC